jgi:hypothetical protein
MYTEETGGELLGKLDNGIYTVADIGCFVPDQIIKLPQGEQIIQQGKGIVRGVSNYKEQPGKTLTLFDGETTICILQLATTFFGETIFDPGMILDVAFSKNLRTVTDGEDISVIWY